MPTIELPDFWLLVNPEGVADGSMIAVRRDGSICAATAEDAWATFTPRKRDREKEAREGWRMVGVDQAGFQRYFVEREPVPESQFSETGAGA